MRNLYLSIARLEISTQISRGFDDVLPFFADEYTVCDFQIVESRKDVFKNIKTVGYILQKLQSSINIFAKTRGVV